MPNLDSISRFIPATRAKHNLIGQLLGCLLVVAGLRNKYGHLFWLCLCTCGGNTIASDRNLRVEGQTTCRPCVDKARGVSNSTHGMTKTHTYSCWKAMRQRCNNPNADRYENWGGRGITVCARWDKFENFLGDMGEAPGPEYSIERKDNDGNYCPENCYWITIGRQQRNKRNTIRLTFKERTQSVSDWADETGLPVTALRGRVQLRWSVERTLTEPLNEQYRCHTSRRSPV